MKALTRAEYGPPAVVTVRDVPEPEVAAGRVRVGVVAGGIDQGTLHLMRGTPTLGRLAFGLRRPRNPVLGLDVAGVVDAVGADVTGFAVGDAVFGTADGALAGFAVTTPGRLAAKPAVWSFDEAAAVPVSGLTALQALRDQARVRPGQRVLVVGASGGVGHFAVQLGVALGCEVVGVCSPGKADVVRALGASEVLDRAGRLPVGGFDAVLAIGGDRPIAELKGALRASGRLVLVGSSARGFSGGMGRNLVAVLGSALGRQKVSLFVSSENAADLAELAGYGERGQLRPHLDAVVPLAEGRAALERLLSGAVTGKVVVRVADAAGEG